MDEHVQRKKRRLFILGGKNGAVIRRLFSENFLHYWRYYALAAVFMIMVSGSTALSAWIMRDVVNAMLINHDMKLLLPLCFVIIAIFATKGLSSYGQDVTLGRVGNRIVADVQQRVYKHVLKFGLDYFTRTPSSELVMRVSGGANSARDVINMIVVSFGRDLLTLISLISVMLIQTPVLTIITLVIAPIAIFGVSRLIRRVRGVMEQEFLLATRAMQLLQETVLGARIIKSFNLEPRMRGQMEEAVLALEQRANRLISLQARSSPLMESLGGMAIGIILLYAGWASAKGDQTPGNFISFLTAFLFAYEPAKRLARLQINLEQSIFGVNMMFDVLDSPADATEREDGPVLHSGDLDIYAKNTKTGLISFDSVEFSYRTGQPVLRGISVDIAPHSKTALVGPSGGGKSTLFALLQRFYDVNKGVIRVGGQDIRDLSVSSLRGHIAFVSQDTYLFAGNIRDNIRIGRLDASNEEIETAARDAYAHDFISALPKGYETNVGENGVQLSGGQRQRIAIARAILKGAPILLLDEATSALDSQSEHMVQMALDRLMQGRTTLVIAHRLTTILNADRILVLDGGRIVEDGDHDALLKKQGLYASLYHHQFEQESTSEA